MSIPAPTPDRGHECDLPYPYLYTDELPQRPGPVEYAFDDVPEPPGARFVSIDNPRYDDGLLVRCPVCRTWWVFRTHPTGPHTAYSPGRTMSFTQCVTTYKPAWHLVGFWDRALRRRIREAEASGDVGEFPPPPVIPGRHPLADTPPRTF